MEKQTISQLFHLDLASCNLETTEYSKIQPISDPYTMFSKFSWFNLIILGTCLFVKVQSIVCPGGQAECPVNMSCCSLPDGTFGCCPFLNAVCCVDHLHCCPAETTCDLTHGQCKNKEGGVTCPWKEHLSAIMTGNELNSSINASPAKVAKPTTRFNENSEGNIRKFANALTNSSSHDGMNKIVCPGSNNQTCADGYTCCMNTLGSYGCCPIKDAVCCDDKVHCCPKDAVCDSKAGKCSTKTSLLKSRHSRSKNVICPGGDFQCPDRSTCCHIAGGQYGCCPLENATCCGDQVHCCPQNFTCGVGGVCVRSP